MLDQVILAPKVSLGAELDQIESFQDFMVVYLRHLDQIQESLTRDLIEDAAFGPLIHSMSDDMREKQHERSKEMLATAFRTGQWAIYWKDLEEQGAGYAQGGIEFASWFNVIGLVRSLLIKPLFESFGADPARVQGALTAMDGFFDKAMAAIGEGYLNTKERIIRQRQSTIFELSTPVLQLRDRLLMMPIVGVVDTQRARQLTEHLLQGIRNARAKVVVIDVTGVAAVDSRVANHLLQTVDAARLMGATCVVSGISADVAQTLVTLGVDLTRLTTVGDLQGGIEEAERILGIHVAKAIPRNG